MLNQVVAVGVSVGYTVGGTGIILLVIKTIMQIRPNPEEERVGIDIIEHGEKAYGETSR